MAFRMALDHPEVVTHLGELDILPTIDNWAALNGTAGVFAFHLFFLAQPNDLPERLIGADSDMFFGHFLDTWTKAPGANPADVREHYLSVLRHTDAIHAICDDYRASAEDRLLARHFVNTQEILGKVHGFIGLGTGLNNVVPGAAIEGDVAVASCPRVKGGDGRPCRCLFFDVG